MEEKDTEEKGSMEAKGSEEERQGKDTEAKDGARAKDVEKARVIAYSTWIFGRMKEQEHNHPIGDGAAAIGDRTVGDRTMD